MLHLPIWCQNFGRIIRHQDMLEGEYKGGTPLDGHTYYWGGIGAKKFGMYGEDGSWEGERHPFGIYLPTKENV